MSAKKFQTHFGYINIFDDGANYKYGTKQRVIEKYINIKNSEGINEFVYAGPAAAMGAYALANGCKKKRVLCTLFLSGSQLPLQAKDFEKSKYIDIRLFSLPFYQVQELAEEYVSESTERMIVPFGIEDELYISLLQKSIKKDPNIQEYLSTEPKRLWLAVGSGVLLKVLMDIFPNTEFHCVQVGKSLKFQNKRIITYWSPEKFSQPATITPPYSSLANYDAKVWQHILKYGEDDDWIWNVAANY